MYTVYFIFSQVASATATRFGLSRGLLGLQYDQINESESESESESVQRSGGDGYHTPRVGLLYSAVVGKYRFWDNSPYTWLKLFNYIQINHIRGWDSVIIRHHPCSNHTYGWDIASMLK